MCLGWATNNGLGNGFGKMGGDSPADLRGLLLLNVNKSNDLEACVPCGTTGLYAGPSPVYLCRHRWPYGTPAPDGNLSQVEKTCNRVGTSGKHLRQTGQMGEDIQPSFFHSTCYICFIHLQT